MDVDQFHRTVDAALSPLSLVLIYQIHNGALY